MGQSPALQDLRHIVDTCCPPEAGLCAGPVRYEGIPSKPVADGLPILGIFGKLRLGLRHDRVDRTIIANPVG